MSAGFEQRIEQPVRLLDSDVFFVIGAMKAGTSSLYASLAQHPALFGTPVKEPSFFTIASPTDEQIAWYRNLFADLGTRRWGFEASTNYTKSPRFADVAPRIRRAFPRARLVYMLRQPLDRVYSHYMDNVAAGRETRAFDDAVLGDDPHYVNVSRYYYQLGQYANEFPPEQILVVLFEDYVRDPLGVLRRIFLFLDVDPSVEIPQAGAARNRTQGKHADGRLLRGLKSHAWYRSIPRPVRQGAAWVVGSLLRRPLPRLADIRSPATDARLRELLDDDMCQLGKFLGRDLAEWHQRGGADRR